tara:strand:- start:137 stop:388 length:252 start_codon:yes stop_codon:yes gene_type:complete
MKKRNFYRNDVDYEITDESLFYDTVIDVDTEDLKRMAGGYGGADSYRGTISIETEDRGWVDITGEHGAYDYEDEYGFIIVYTR